MFRYMAVDTQSMEKVMLFTHCLEFYNDNHPHKMFTPGRMVNVKISQVNS